MKVQLRYVIYDYVYNKSSLSKCNNYFITTIRNKTCLKNMILFYKLKLQLFQLDSNISPSKVSININVLLCRISFLHNDF